ncbi:MAG TPA: hypothetical protein VH702_03540 [Vicinamibacterales bacterium]
MTRRFLPRLFVLLIVLAVAVPMSAAVKTEEKTLLKFSGMLGRVVGLFGGKAAKDGLVSTVAVNGQRKARLNDTNGQIIDLAEEKVYDLDIKRKAYTVTTFEELRRRLKEAQAKAQEQAQKADPEEKKKAEDAAQDVEVDFDVKDTGQRKSVNGFEARQVIATVTVREKGKTLEDSGGLVLTSDMWLTPTIQTLKEITDFDRRYWEKIAGPMVGDVEQMAAAMAVYPLLKNALARLEQEKVKTDGTAVMTTVTVDAVKSKEEMAKKPETSESAPTSIGGLLGGLGRRGSKPAAAENPARATFMTSTHEVLRVSTDVTDTDVAIPAGFKERK